ncbi:MAG: cytochrome b/b6 domain-containing protein [Deferrisomatales bacterium]
MNGGEVRRFPTDFVWQHGLLIATFTVLTVTGFPLKWQWWGMIKVMGGYGVVKFVHQAAGLIMILQGIVHVAHAVTRQLETKQLGGLWPSTRDVQDVLQDCKYLLGLSKEKAKYPRYSYINKFDYWGAFWGIAIMGGTGIVLWFPRVFSDVVIHVSHIAHTDEAVLAAGAIFIWHIYHVHTRYGRFRLNRVWLTGRIRVEDLKIEHPEEYEQLAARGEIPPAP